MGYIERSDDAPSAEAVILEHWTFLVRYWIFSFSNPGFVPPRSLAFGVNWARVVIAEVDPGKFIFSCQSRLPLFSWT